MEKWKNAPFEDFPQMELFSILYPRGYFQQHFRNSVFVTLTSVLAMQLANKIVALEGRQKAAFLILNHGTVFQRCQRSTASPGPGITTTPTDNGLQMTRRAILKSINLWWEKAAKVLFLLGAQ